MPGRSQYKHDDYVECQYYRKENAIEIKCKGLCGSHTVNVFPSGIKKTEWKEDFCKGLPTSCPLYISLKEGEQ